MATTRLGDLLLEAGSIRQKDLDRALTVQAGSNRRLGYLLIKMGYISEQELQSVLSAQLGIPIVDIHQAFSREVRSLLPRYLCKRYNVIPLSLGDHNLLAIAMVDPSDNEAVRDIERFTGKVLQPRLAPHSDINNAISHYIPWSLQDIFNRNNTGKISAAAAVIALTLIAVLMIQYQNDRSRQLHGIRRVNGNAVLYQNQDLILSFDQSGKISLKGHGAHADGTYSITFDNPDSLRIFLQRKKDDLSLNQQQWVRWVMNNQIKNR